VLRHKYMRSFCSLLACFATVASAAATSFAPLGERHSCLADFSSLQFMTMVSSSEAVHAQSPMKTMRAGELQATHVVFDLDSVDGQSDQLEATIRFDPKFTGVSLPYNLQAVLMVKGGEVLGWWDFTHACTGPGVSFFPGRVIYLPKVKLIGVKPEPLQIIVWGKL
jgi:hypothetical protein